MGGLRVWLAVGAALGLFVLGGCKGDEQPPALGTRAGQGAVTPPSPPGPRPVGEPSALSGPEEEAVVAEDGGPAAP